MKQIEIGLILGIFALVSTAEAALKPLGSDLKPSNGELVAVYKTTPEDDLKINLYFAKDWSAADRRPGIVFFFGGGFVSGSPTQFTTTAEYFARRGLVAATAEYRIRNTHHTGPEKSIEDAKSALRWLRANAGSLGIDPRRIVAGGGSAGGTCAAFAAFNTTYEPGGEDRSISSTPDALVLYNPALGFPADTTGYSEQQMERVKALGAFLTAWRVTPGGPPAILFFGTKDSLAERARVFAQDMIAAGNRAEFYTAAGQDHGFFNDRPGNPWHALVVRQTDLFLTSLGYLKGEPAMSVPAGTKEALQKVLP
jgi:acetyl esterase/lipase